MEYNERMKRKCGLCKNKLAGRSVTFKLLGDQRAQTNFPLILERHFWPNVTIDCNNTGYQPGQQSGEPICDDCYTTINHFHDFYTSIEEIHRIFVAKIDIEVMRFKEEVEPDEVVEIFSTNNRNREHIECTEVAKKVKIVKSIKIEPVVELKIEPAVDIIDFDDFDQSITRDDDDSNSTNCDDKVNVNNIRPVYNKFSCIKCYNFFNSLKELKAHKRMCMSPEPQSAAPIVHDEIERYCPICQKVFPQRSNYADHVRNAHKDVDTRVSCDICQWISPDIYRLAIHMRVNHFHPPVVCQICGKVYSHNFFGRHLLTVHSGKRQVCEICGRSFKIGHSYIDHMSIHTGVHLYSCRFCNRSFRINSEMYKHVKKYHLAQYMEFRKDGKKLHSRKTSKPVPVVHKLRTFKNLSGQG